jgi:hypothetical protein
LWLVPDQPGAAGEQRALLARLRAVVEAKDAEVAMLRTELEAERELRRLLELRLAEFRTPDIVVQLHCVTHLLAWPFAVFSGVSPVLRDRLPEKIDAVT